VVQLISQLRGYFYVNPVLALSLAITIFSFVGVPPLVGFFAKQMVLSAALDSGYVFLSLVAILTSVVGAVYVCPLITITPRSLNLTFETLKFIGYKPVNLSDFEMNRGVQHVDKSSTVSNIFAVFLYVVSYLLTIALVPLSHVKFNLPVNFVPVTLPRVMVPMISLKSRLSRYIVSFGRPETISLRELAKREITDVLVRTGDLLKEVIPKIRFKLISIKNYFFIGRQSFRSIDSYRCREGKQNLINKFSSARVSVGLISHFARTRPLLVRTEELMVKLTLGKIRFISNEQTGCCPQIKSNLNYWFITGFTDAEGMFGISLIKSPSTRLGWTIHLNFQIGLHKKDIELLNNIKTTLGGVGSISEKGDEAYFRVQSLEQIFNVIVPHFDKYPLITQKLADYILFREIVMKMLQKEHLNKKGLQEIVNIRASLNLGLSEKLKAAFPKTIPVSRLFVENSKIPDPEWIAGFTSGEGCFYVGAWKTPDRRLGVRVTLKFMITQHSRDEQLMNSLVDFFRCGSYSLRNNLNKGEFVVAKFSDVTDKIIPFFYKYKIRGVKSWDFQDWCRVVELMKANSHLTPEGLDQIRQIKNGMNKGRMF
jgi:hypothetical protein